MREYDPALCVFWHQFNSLHYSMPDFCTGLGIPMLYAEYGSLPATIAFDSEGQMAESWAARRSDDFLNLPVSDEELSRTRRFLELARKQKRTRKPLTAPASIQAVSEAAARSGRRLVFYAGQHDYKTGMAPRSLPNAELHSPFFESTADALRHLCAIAEERNWHILFKPHPLAGHLLKRADMPGTDWLDVVPGADIFECMHAAAVTLTIVSQVSYMAILHDRPCVLLGRNQLSGKGCLYEPSSREKAGGRIDEAIGAGLTREQREAWFKHAAQLLGHALYAFEEEVERSSAVTCTRRLPFLSSTPKRLRRTIRHRVLNPLGGLLVTTWPTTKPRGTWGNVMRFCGASIPSPGHSSRASRGFWPRSSGDVEANVQN